MHSQFIGRAIHTLTARKLSSRTLAMCLNLFARLMIAGQGMMPQTYTGSPWSRVLQPHTTAEVRMIPGIMRLRAAVGQIRLLCSMHRVQQEHV
jgi:hypothetical protein